MKETEPQSPREAYAARLDLRQRALGRCERRHDWVANLRLFVFGGAVVVAGATWWWDFPGYLWLAPLAVFYLILLAYHERVLRERKWNARGVDHYKSCFERLEGRWSGTGTPGDIWAPADHPYANDLDIFGTGSLFELLCTARTRAGEECLAGWLTGPAAPETILERQSAVEELRGRLDLREDLARLSEDVRARVMPRLLVAWAQRNQNTRGRSARIVALGLGGVGIGGVVLWISSGFAGLLILVLVIDILFELAYRRAIAVEWEHFEEPCRELELLSQVIARFEREPFTCAYLRRLQESLGETAQPASAAIARLARLGDLMDAPRNMLFAPIALVLLWNIHVLYALDNWRAKWKTHVPGWLDAVGALEALCSLAAYAYEHPDDPFPEIIAPGPIFSGRALAHPLLPPQNAVANDVELQPEQPLVMITGSNMSGKSTLLRTVGVNAVLALAGAPVRAAALHMSPVALGANMRVQDSVQEGKSRFFAEITRLKRLQDIAQGKVPLLFLLDELLHGTNSHDRAIGALGVVRHLVDLGAIGLVTSHDLAVARAVERLPHGRNMHFEDRVEDGRLRFDYLLRPGIVQKSNALQLMRSIGLHVQNEDTL